MRQVPQVQHTVGVYTEPCHVGHFRAFSKAMHINGPSLQQSPPLRSWEGFVYKTVGLFFETYALQIEITACYS